MPARVSLKVIILFLAVGVVNTIFGYGVFFILLQFGLHYLIAYTTSTLAGTLFSYFSYSRFVFRKKGFSRAAKYFVLYGINFLIGAGLLRLLIMRGIDSRLAGAINMLVMTTISFIVQRMIVFVEDSRDEENKPRNALF